MFSKTFIVKKTFGMRSSLKVVLFLLITFLFSATNSLSQEWIYTVQPGDNLWDLSRKHLVSMRYWKKIQDLNQVKDPQNIPPGSTLRFPMAWLKSGSTVARIVYIKGKVEIIRRGTGRVQEAAVNSILWEQDTIRTAADSNVTLRFVDGSTTLLQGDSSLTLEKLKGYGDTGMADTNVRLQKGRLHNKVRPKAGPGSRFEIETPSAIAAVRGTEYRISAEENGESKAEVVKGEVGVDSAEITRIVPAGFGTIAFTDHASLEPVKLLPGPDLSGLPSIIIRVPFPLKLNPLAAAKAYRLQIGADNRFDTLVYDSVFPSNRLWGPDLPDGQYFLRVRGIDKQDLEGLDSVHTFLMDAHPIPPMRIQPVADAVLSEPQPSFHWSEPQDVSGYRFQLAGSDQFENLIIDLARYEETRLTLDQPLDPGVYHWRVAGLDLSGTPGPFSDSQFFRIPPPSLDLSKSEFNADELAFRWRKGDDGQQYRCRIARDQEFADVVVDEQVSKPQYSLKRLEHGTYYISVAIIDIDGYEGPFSPFQTVRIPGPPPSPWLLLIPVVQGLLIAL